MNYIDVYLEFLTGQIKIFINSSHSPVYTPSCGDKLVSSLNFILKKLNYNNKLFHDRVRWFIRYLPLIMCLLCPTVIM